jgi:hypothetical protein
MQMRIHLAVCSILLLFVSQSFAQNRFVSQLDKDLTVRSIVVTTLADNTDGIYSRPLSIQLRAIVENDKQLSLVEYSPSQKVILEELENDSKLAKKILTDSKADAVLAGRITKGQRGMTLRLGLFAGSQGDLLLEEKVENFTGFEIADLRTQLEEMYSKMKQRFPYHGVILSRKGQVVTLNLGKANGINDGDVIDAIQIIKAQRHPKFKFLVGTDKEILGKIKVTKAEEYLSFAEIVLERDENVLQINTKLLPITFVRYPSIPRTADGKQHESLNDRADAPLATGDGAEEWRPNNTPTFGKFAFLLGMGSYAINNNLNATGAVEGKSGFTPSIHFETEMWLTPTWFANIAIRQFIFSVDNGLTGSNPSKLNASVSQYTLQFGYNVLLEDRFSGPKFQLLGGYTKVASKVDGSTPTALTSLGFNGFAFGFGGYFPLDENENPYGFGANFNFYLTASADEAPVTSGSSSSAKMSTLTIYGDYRLSPRLKLRGDLMYDAYNANFSGTGSRDSGPADSASLSSTTIAGGIEYSF